MRKQLIQVFALTGVLLAGLSVQAMSNLCNDPLRNQQICLKMRHLRSQVNLLEEQRDLLQVNYSFTEELTKDMESLTTDLFENHNSDGMLTLIDTVRTKVQKVRALAEKKDSGMLYAANQVHRQCTVCHSTRNPRSGYTWDQIAKLTWGDINLKCNEETIGIRSKETSEGTVWEGVIEAKINEDSRMKRNPYRCKNMHGMFNVLEYFITGNQAEKLNYDMTLEAANEVVRIAEDLKSKKIYHGGEVLFENVKRMATELKTLAKEKNPLVRYKRQELAVACLQCHKEGPFPGGGWEPSGSPMATSLKTELMKSTL